MEGNVSIMGIDPGVTTGVTILTVPVGSLAGDDPSQIVDKKSFEINGPLPSQVMSIGECAVRLSYPYGYRAIMVYEEFDLDPHYHSRDPALLFPVRIIGAIEYAHHMNHFGNVFLTSQSRQLSKTSATDERLRAWGLYTSGSDHIRDATRQAITYIRRLKGNEKMMRMAWGMNYAIR